MKLHRDIDVTQKTAWFMLHRLRDSWGEADLDINDTEDQMMNLVAMTAGKRLMYDDLIKKE